MNSIQLTFEEEDYILEESLEKNRNLGKQVKAENYQEIISDEDNLSHMQNLVYEAISSYPTGINDKGIQRFIKDQFEIFLPISSINARRNELIEKGMVVPIRTDYFPDHNNVLRKNVLWSIL